MDSSEGHSAHDYRADNDGRGSNAPANRSERRMQVQAYNHWAGLLGSAPIPLITTLDPGNPGAFGPNSVLLDLTGPADDPAILHLGAALARECDVATPASHLSRISGQTLLGRMAGHYRPILETHTPIGFEAGFTNQREATILYRGIALPFSSNGNTVDYVLGVVNWKETTAPEGQAALTTTLGTAATPAPALATALMPDWADGPAVDDLADSPPAEPQAAAPVTLVSSGFHALSTDGPEFALVLIHRQPDGTLAVLGEVPHNRALLEQAVRQLASGN